MGYETEEPPKKLKEGVLVPVYQKKNYNKKRKGSPAPPPPKDMRKDGAEHWPKVDVQENVSDNLSSTSMSVSGVSSEVTEEHLQAAQMLDDLLTPSDLGFQSHDFPTGHETLTDEEDLRITPEATEAADFSSDDSVVDRTYAPEIDTSSSSESQGNDDHNVEVTSITEEHNERRKSKGTNIRKIIKHNTISKKNFCYMWNEADLHVE
ncbi:hypothetical protein PYW08_006097 [Mythimna loreyi]|uniref:Uncharacterized protein n=1 Tax=Mythimna loreyi TaxID=667449 RepID=A0ACC2QMN6_9NEOP|nr:hypothetical protein PYW08_006097 [Mythimna loreyi]